MTNRMCEYERINEDNCNDNEKDRASGLCLLGHHSFPGHGIQEKEKQGTHETKRQLTYWVGNHRTVIRPVSSYLPPPLQFLHCQRS